MICITCNITGVTNEKKKTQLRIALTKAAIRGILPQWTETFFTENKVGKADAVELVLMVACKDSVVSNYLNISFPGCTTFMEWKHKCRKWLENSFKRCLWDEYHKINIQPTLLTR